jgi:H+/Cl- antiporter ClcA
LVLALLIGAVGGLAAVVYTEFTGFGTDLFFGDPSSEPFSGQWWWIPLLSGGAVVVVALRRWTGVADKVPGAVAYARKGWVEPSTALPLFAISALSLFVGASLGPSFGIVISGGGFGSWLAQRTSVRDVEAQHEYAITGMAGGLSAVFAAPVFGSIMATELAPTPRSRYVAQFIAAFIASVIGFVIFVELDGTGLLGAFQITGYEYENIHLLYGLLLGVLAIAVLLVQAVLGNIVRRLSALLDQPLQRAAVLGALVGFLAFALPLTATGGSVQLAFETSNLSELSLGLLSAVLVAKIVAFVASQEAGFLGGPVFPILFIGGTAGIIVHLVFPDIPAPLSVAAMMAAVPGATIAAPVSFILLAGGVVVVGVSGLPPIGIAVITAHLAVWGLEVFRETRDSM